MTESAPVKHKACPWEDRPPEPLSHNSMPKTTKHVEGQIHLSGWRGSPKELQTAMELAKFSAHCLVSSGPTVRKSSKNCMYLG